MSLESVCSGE